MGHPILILNDLCVGHNHKSYNQSLDEAREWLRRFSELLSLLYRHKNARELRVPIQFKGTELIPGYTLGRLLSEEEKYISEDERNNIKYFSDKGKYLEDFADITDDEGIFTFQDIWYIFQFRQSIARGFGVAYLLKMMAISFDNDEDWDSSSVEIECFQNSGTVQVTIEHASKASHVGIAKREFERSPKHDVAHDIVIDNQRISQLDLSDEEAQVILEKAVTAHKGKRLFGYSDRTSKFYAFLCHREGYFHGYPIELTEIKFRSQVLRNLVVVGLISQAFCDECIKGT